MTRRRRRLYLVDEAGNTWPLNKTTIAACLGLTRPWHRVARRRAAKFFGLRKGV